jgi:16S rRNA (adenine1518-N6/adenine1519-N6)-dimethyltransferase
VTLTRTEVHALFDRYGISPKRSLGQNFVVEPNTVRRIAQLAAVGAGDRVVEIGPGLGSLTIALTDAGASVTAIEIDDVLVEVLAETTAGRDVTVLHADAMDVDWDSLLGGFRWTLVANLPYNISVPLICDLLDDVPAIHRMLVMVQKEVAERLVAVPGDGAYGLPSVKVAYHSRARIVGRVPPSANSKRPSRRWWAPVNAPRSWPKSSDSIKVSGMAAQLSSTKAPFLPLNLWMTLAIRLLPKNLTLPG